MIAPVFTLITALMLGAAVVLAVVRIIRGPSAVDRGISNEVLVSTMVCALGVEAAVNRHTTTLPILVSLSLVGFLASVAIARFAARDRDGVQLGGDGREFPETGPRGTP